MNLSRKNFVSFGPIKLLSSNKAKKLRKKSRYVLNEAIQVAGWNIDIEGFGNARMTSPQFYMDSKRNSSTEVIFRRKCWVFLRFEIKIYLHKTVRIRGYVPLNLYWKIQSLINSRVHEDPLYESVCDGLSTLEEINDSILKKDV